MSDPLPPTTSTLSPTGGTGGGEPAPLGRFGDYELQEEIARGGMGVVFKARQVSLNRSVALKMILAGQFAGETDVARFRLEAEAAAALDHAHIVPIYEVGEVDGQHFFTMKLIEGGSLAGLVPQLVNDSRQAVRLMALVARAVHHAHQRGILHRDLKPANVLLDADGTPYVGDFGLARRAQVDRGLTQSGAIVGTPAYMSPEQAGGRKDLTVTVDVYSLGAVFYECLTGRPPFCGDTPLDTILQVLERDAEPPRQVRPGLDRDLDAVVMRCLEKDPARRYPSALALAEDLDRWLAGEAVSARPLSVYRRAMRWWRRRPVLLATVAVAGLLGCAVPLLVLGLDADGLVPALLTAIFMGGMLFAVLASGLKDQQRVQRQLEKLAAGQADTLPAAEPPPAAPAFSRRAVAAGMFRGSWFGAVAALVGLMALYLGLGWPTDPLSLGLTLALPQGLTLGAVVGGVVALGTGAVPTVRFFLTWAVVYGFLGFAPAYDWDPVIGHSRFLLWAAGLMGVLPLLFVLLHQLPNWKGGWRRPDQAAAFRALLRLFWAEHDRKILGVAVLAAVMLAGAVLGREVGYRLGGATAAVLGGLLTPLAAWALAAALGWLRDEEPERIRFTRQPLAGVLGACAAGWLLWHTRAVDDSSARIPLPSPPGRVAVSADGRTLLTTSAAGVRLRNTTTGAVQSDFSSDRPGVFGKPWPAGFLTPDGAVFQATLRELRLHRREANGQWKTTTLPLVQAMHVVADARGERLLVHTRDSLGLTVWDLRTKRQRRYAIGGGDVVDLAWSASGSVAAVAFADGRLQLLTLEPQFRVRRLVASGLPLRAVAVTPDGSLALTAGADWTIRLWDTSIGAAVGRLFGHRAAVNALAVSPDGRRALSAGDDRSVRLWDVEKGRLLATYRGHTAAVRSVAFQPDGASAVSAGEDNAVRFWDLP